MEIKIVNLFLYLGKNYSRAYTNSRRTPVADESKLCSAQRFDINETSRTANLYQTQRSVGFKSRYKRGQSYDETLGNITHQ